jgi:hypothetical protein
MVMAEVVVVLSEKLRDPRGKVSNARPGPGQARPGTGNQKRGRRALSLGGHASERTTKNVDQGAGLSEWSVLVGGQASIHPLSQPTIVLPSTSTRIPCSDLLLILTSLLDMGEDLAR